jgi:beta-1,2-mannosidase
MNRRLVGISAACLLSIPMLYAQSTQPWMIGPFTRPATGNPVIAPLPASTFGDPIQKTQVHWEALHTFNPAAIVRKDKVYVLYRAEDDSGAMEIGGHTSRLGLAESSDGIHFTRMGEPVFYPEEDDQKAREWPGGVEDPRIVEREDGTYVLTYTQWNRATYSVGIATSRDLMHWTKYGPAFLTAAGGKYAQLKYKSAGIVTRVVKDRLIAARISGMYWMYWGEGAIHVATSPDLIHWTPVQDQRGDPVELLHPRAGHFDSTFPETGPPPVLTSAGIVVLYNGKNAASGGDPDLGPNAYAAGEALFDPINPMHLLTQTDEPVLKPELPYEKTGQYAAGTTFAEGLVYFRKQWFLYYGCADSLVAVATAPATLTVELTEDNATGARPSPEEQTVNTEQTGEARPTSGFYLRNGETVVFYGDSITEQNLYNQYVELYAATRFPAMRVRFFGAGVGGDRVTGGSGGPIDQRLERDVFAENPTVVTLMLGMNDGSYRATTPDIESSYTKGYEHLLQSIRDHAPGARITLLGPSPYDDVNGAPMFPGGYNSVMQHFGDLDNALAQKFGGTFVDLNPSVVTALQRAKALDPRIARMLLPDRVHPDPLAHWVMAEALLKGWNAPALVSSVTIDGPAGTVTEAQNAAVDHLEHNAASVRWNELDNALPLPLSRSNATQALLFDLTDIEQQLDQEPLRVTGLDPGTYTLRIDDALIGTFSSEQLTNGINLADFETPMFHQAQRVSWLVRDRDEAHYIHLRMRVRNANTGLQTGGPDVMQAFEDSLEDSIYAEAVPKAHVFTLSLIGAQP